MGYVDHLLHRNPKRVLFRASLKFSPGLGTNFLLCNLCSSQGWVRNLMGTRDARLATSFSCVDALCGQ